MSRWVRKNNDDVALWDGDAYEADVFNDPAMELADVTIMPTVDADEMVRLLRDAMEEEKDGGWHEWYGRCSAFLARIPEGDK